jgi:hypothetical protein
MTFRRPGTVRGMRANPPPGRRGSADPYELAAAVSVAAALSGVVPVVASPGPALAARSAYQAPIAGVLATPVPAVAPVPIGRPGRDGRLPGGGHGEGRPEQNDP